MSFSESKLEVFHLQVRKSKPPVSLKPTSVFPFPLSSQRDQLLLNEGPLPSDEPPQTAGAAQLQEESSKLQDVVDKMVTPGLISETD